MALGAPLGALIAAFWGWRGTFGAVALLGSPRCVLWLRLPRASAEQATSPSAWRHRRPGVASSLMVDVSLSYRRLHNHLLSRAAGDRTEPGFRSWRCRGCCSPFGRRGDRQSLQRLSADRLGATRVVTASLIMRGSRLADDRPSPCIPHARSRRLLLIGIMVPWGIVGWRSPAQASRIVGFAPEVAHLTLSLNASASIPRIATGTAIGGRCSRIPLPPISASSRALSGGFSLAVLYAGAEIPSAAPGDCGGGNRRNMVRGPAAKSFPLPIVADAGQTQFSR